MENKPRYMNEEPYKGAGIAGWILSGLIVSYIFLMIGLKLSTVILMILVIPFFTEIIDNLWRLWNELKK